MSPRWLGRRDVGQSAHANSPTIRIKSATASTAASHSTNFFTLVTSAAASRAALPTTPTRRTDQYESIGHIGRSDNSAQCGRIATIWAGSRSDPPSPNDRDPNKRAPFSDPSPVPPGPIEGALTFPSACFIAARPVRKPCSSRKPG